MVIPLPTMDTLATFTIASPCSVPWAEMRGDEQTRFCGHCQKQVFDLTAMTTAEVVELLHDPRRRPCVRLYRRADGRVMTADCPVGLRARVWRSLQRRATWAASLFAMLVFPACRMATQGMSPEDYPAVAASLRGLENTSAPADVDTRGGK